jgi:hypothetical protein
LLRERIPFAMSVAVLTVAIAAVISFKGMGFLVDVICAG